MPADVQFIENPTITIVPPPNRGGRYQIEFRSGQAACPAPGGACGHESPQALLWLIYLEAGQEAGREVSDLICSACEPGRYARAQAWAEALG